MRALNNILIVATPQATPKRLTDEELKQQYGIHLASRQEEDGDGKEAKWADIDDDEDDWAPETIEWNDGTKINLAQNDSAAVFAEEQAAIEATKEKEEQVAKSKILLAKPTTTVGPNATVLKLGSAAQPKVGGLVLKAPSDKPTLVAKPSSTSTVKSPWASLPPVDKVSPIPINPSAQSPSARFTQRDPHGFDSMPPPPPHAKEIAADDFSRSSRDTVTGNPKELFNSQSGRYEPVNETRRASMRKEQNFRAPSLLQRPLQNDQNGPAEPSPAFQTFRSGIQQDPGLWNRRRTSSNVSGESGNLDRRMSLSKASELPSIPGGGRRSRRDSLRDPSPMTPEAANAKWAHRGVSPVDSRGPSVASQSPTVAVSHPNITSNSSTSSPLQSKVLPNGLPTSTPMTTDPKQEAVAAQKKLMREKREAAIKRKKEEEEKEEAAKKERIRLKMEKLGLVDDKKGKREAAEEAASLPVVSPAVVREVATVIPRSPPKPPLPDASGVPQQYGMMKLHGPQPVNGIQVKSPLPEKEVQAVHKGEENILAPEIDAKPVTMKETVTPLLNGIIASKSPETPALQSAPVIQPSVSPDPRLQSWKGVSQDPNVSATWNGTGMTTHSSPGGNLWGPPSNHRALGNGDFYHAMPRVQSRQPPQYPQHLISPTPHPIGPPRHLQQSLGSQPSAYALENLSRSAVEESQTVPGYPTPDSTPPKLNGQITSQEPTNSMQIGQVARSTALLADASTRGQLSQSNEAKRAGLSAWANFGVTSAKVEAERNEKAFQERAARLAEERRTGITQEPQMPIINETWRQVRTGDNAGERQVVAALKTQRNAQPLGSTQQIMGDRAVESVSMVSGVNGTVPTSRSRFFSAGQAIPPHNQRAVSNPLGFSRPASPPPPDSRDHPAYNGIDQRPMVNLPFVKPKPTVKLPPSFSVVKQVAAVTESRMPSLRAVSQPLVANPSWQDRFNGLFDRKPSPEKKFAHVVDFSTSKVPLELTSVEDPAVITLPPQEELETSEEPVNNELPMKTVEDEDALFEERDFGSVPTVHIPKDSPLPVPEWQRVKPLKSSKARLKHPAELEVQSVLPMINGLEDSSRATSTSITIRLGAMRTPKFKTLPRPNGQGSGRPRQSMRPNSPRGKQGKAPRARESSATFGPVKPASNAPSRSPARSIPTQQGRPKINNNNITWARRASGVVQ